MTIETERTIGPIPSCPMCHNQMVEVARQTVTVTVACSQCHFMAIVNPRTGTWLRLRKGEA